MTPASTARSLAGLAMSTVTVPLRLVIALERLADATPALHQLANAGNALDDLAAAREALRRLAETTETLGPLSVSVSELHDAVVQLNATVAPLQSVAERMGRVVERLPSGRRRAVGGQAP